MRSQLGDTIVNQMGEVLRVWKLKGRLKLKKALEEDLLGLANSGGLGVQRSNGSRMAGSTMTSSREETRKQDNSKEVPVSKGW